MTSFAMSQDSFEIILVLAALISLLSGLLMVVPRIKRRDEMLKYLAGAYPESWKALIAFAAAGYSAWERYARWSNQLSRRFYIFEYLWAGPQSSAIRMLYRVRKLDVSEDPRFAQLLKKWRWSLYVSWTLWAIFVTTVIILIVF